MQVFVDWLVQLREHYQDHAWLAAHADPLYHTIETALNIPPQVNDAMDALISICPYVFTRSDFKRWSALLFDALLNAQLMQDDQLQMHIWTQMGEGYYVEGRYNQALNSFQTAFERARDGHIPEMMLSAYIGIIKLQSLRPDATFNDDFVAEVRSIASQVSDLSLLAELHYSLAAAYIHRGDTVTALGYGQIAYAYWLRLKNTIGMARAAFMLADACRVGKCLKQAERFLNIASSLFTRVEYSASYCLITYEEGILYLHQKQYEDAQQWLSMALEESIKLDHPYYIAMAHHSLGIAQIETRRFADAEKNLKTALKTWEKLDNRFHQANLYQALGYLENQRGNSPQAHRWLQQALSICPLIPDMPHRQMIEQLIAETIAEIK